MIDTVFVYGTLKPDLRYHHVAQQGGAFTKEEAYIEGFDLYHLEPENYPAIIRGKGRVHGWLYSYEDINNALVFMDELEGIHLDPPEYERIETIAFPSEKTVWVYLGLQFERYKEKSAVKVQNGIWLPSNAQQGLVPKGIEEKG